MEVKKNIYRCLFLMLSVFVSFSVNAAEIVATGTGIVVNNRGIIATGYSVVDGAKDIIVYGLGSSITEAYRAEIVRTDPAAKLAILKVKKRNNVKRTKAGTIYVGDTARIIYDHFTIFNNEVKSVKAVFSSVGPNHMIFDKLENLDEVTLGAAVINKKNEIVGYVTKGHTGKPNSLMLIENIKEFPADTIDSIPSVAPMVCAVVSYDEKVTIEEGVATELSLTEYTEEERREELFKRLGLEMISVEGGTFMMGCSGNSAECSKDEKPAHEVKVAPFKIAKFEVTQRQWELIMHNNPSPIKGEDLPVYNVSFDDAQEFIKRLNEFAGTKFRLPAEAEWEFAARGGTQSKGLKYAGSNNLDEVAWYRDNANAKPHKVGTKKPNELGIYDMCGNVSEWCIDDYKSYGAPDYKPYYYSRMEKLLIPDTVKVANRDSFAIYKIAEEEKIKTKLTAGRKVMRGSGYFYEKARCNISYRRACATTDKYTFGFRLAE